MTASFLSLDQSAFIALACVFMVFLGPLFAWVFKKITMSIGFHSIGSSLWLKRLVFLTAVWFIFLTAIYRNAVLLPIALFLFAWSSAI